MDLLLKGGHFVFVSPLIRFIRLHDCKWTKSKQQVYFLICKNIMTLFISNIKAVIQSYPPRRRNTRRNNALFFYVKFVVWPFCTSFTHWNSLKHRLIYFNYTHSYHNHRLKAFMQININDIKSDPATWRNKIRLHDKTYVRTDVFIQKVQRNLNSHI